MPAGKRKDRARKAKDRIVIIDDHPIVRQGLAELINHERDLVVCGEAEDAINAMLVIKETDPDLVIVDISLKGRSGVELIKDIKTKYPDLPILTVSMHDESVYAERALRAGACGYIMKEEATTNVVAAVHSVLGGNIYLSSKMAAKMVRKLVSGGPVTDDIVSDRLSDRELEVFRMIGEGDGTNRIAEILHISVKTVETYREHIKQKLNLSDAIELRKYAISWISSKGGS